MRTTNFQVTDDLFLVHVALDAATAAHVPEQVHHVAVIDCSGSMAGDLPELRQQLKRKLPKLIAEDDTLSMIAFSGRGECYVVLEAEPVATIADLSACERAIDRWLRPVGLTGFQEPLQAVRLLVDRIRTVTGDTSAQKLQSIAPLKKRGTFSVFFMTDGCDNQWPVAEIMRALNKAAEVVSAITIVEYGYHADRPMLTKMAERVGGKLLFAEDFHGYQPTFEAEMARRSPASKSRWIEFSAAPVGDLVWTQEDGELRTYEISDVPHQGSLAACKRVTLPEHVKGFFFLSARAEGTAPILGGPEDGEIDDHEREERARLGKLEQALYAAISLFACRMRPEIVLPLLRQTGDVRLIDMFAGCFGKQQYSNFMEAAREAVFDEQKRCVHGYDPDRVPAPDAFTVIELMQILEEDNARVLLDHPDFAYARISRRRVDADGLLTLEEQARVADINAQICGERDVAKVRALQTEVEQILANKPVPLRFKPEERPDGYPITSLTWNEDRPNLSFKTRVEGTVDLSGRLPPELVGVIPSLFPTFQYRDRAIVADGIVHLRALPVRVSEAAAKRLAERLPAHARGRKLRVGDGWVEGTVFPGQLPVLNRRMVLGEALPCGLPGERPSAERLFRLQFKLERVRAAQKVYKAFRDEVIPKKESPSFRQLYGERAAEWLKAQGFTEYSGFCPRMLTKDSGDYYLGKEMLVKLRGYSSLPSLNEYRKQVAELKAGKRKSFTPAAELMRPYVEEVKAAEHGFAEDNTEEAARDAFVGWIDEKADNAIAVARMFLREIAQIKFAVIVGQVWFEEWKSIDENTLEFDCDGVRVQGKVELREIEVKV